MSTHTQGKLHTGGNGTIIYDQQGWGVASATVYHARQEPQTSEANARRLAACWNACEGVSTERLESDWKEGYEPWGHVQHLQAQRDSAQARVDWLQQMNTLHRQVDILYVVDGYQVTITWDDTPISDPFHGKTVAEAIDNAMAGFDPDARNKFREEDVYGHERQMAALAAQRDQLLAALEGLVRINEEHNEAVSKVVGRPVGWKDNYLDAARKAISSALGGAPAPLRYTSTSKGGSYEKLSIIRGAGRLKGFAGIAYRDTTTGELFVREPECFAARMKPIEGGAA